MNNWDYIVEEYEKRNLVALIAEYNRLDLFVTYVVDTLGDSVDDDTEQRYLLVQQVICQKLLHAYKNNFNAFDDYKYMKWIGFPNNQSFVQ